VVDQPTGQSEAVVVLQAVAAGEQSTGAVAAESLKPEAALAVQRFLP
jgi:hypothetical protein